MASSRRRVFARGNERKALELVFWTRSTKNETRTLIQREGGEKKRGVSSTYLEPSPKLWSIQKLQTPKLQTPLLDEREELTLFNIRFSTFNPFE